MRESGRGKERERERVESTISILVPDVYVVPGGVGVGGTVWCSWAGRLLLTERLSDFSNSPALFPPKAGPAPPLLFDGRSCAAEQSTSKQRKLLPLTLESTFLSFSPSLSLSLSLSPSHSLLSIVHSVSSLTLLALCDLHLRNFLLSLSLSLSYSQPLLTFSQLNGDLRESPINL